MALVKIPWTAQPPDNVNVNWGHPLCRDLIWTAPLGKKLRNPVENKLAAFPDTTATGTTYDSMFQSIVHESNTTDDGGFYHPDCVHASNKINGSTDLTALLFCELDDIVANAPLMLTPTANTGWSSPYIVWSLSVNPTDNSKGHFSISYSGAWPGAVSATGFYNEDGTRHMYGAVKNNTTTVTFYKDGLLFGTGTATNMNQALTLQSSNDISVFSRNRSATAEGTNGRFIVGAIWARSLNASEILSWYKNPWQIFEPRTIWIPTAAAAGSTPIHFRRHVGFSYG